MDNNEIIKGLNALKKIEPDNDFAFGAKKVILAEKHGGNGVPFWVWGFGFALLLMAIVSSSFFAPTEHQISLLDSEMLKEELKGITLSLEEIEYHQDINTTIVSALSEISTSQAKHLHLRVLEAEQDIIKRLEYDGSEIEDMLDSIIF